MLTGSSFSLPPYDYEFLASGLQSDVLNMSVGAGGATVALQNYLVDGAYEAAKPKLLVWEFPTFAPGISEEEKRELLASVDGRCDAAASTVQLGEGGSEQPLLTHLRRNGEPVDTRTGYLQVEFSDLSVLTFELTLEYDSGKKETLRVARSNLVPNRGLYFFSLSAKLGDTLERIHLDLPSGAEGQISVRACQKGSRNTLQTEAK